MVAVITNAHGPADNPVKVAVLAPEDVGVALLPVIVNVLVTLPPVPPDQVTVNPELVTPEDTMFVMALGGMGGKVVGTGVVGAGVVGTGVVGTGVVGTGVVGPGVVGPEGTGVVGTGVVGNGVVVIRVVGVAGKDDGPAVAGAVVNDVVGAVVNDDTVGEGVIGMVGDELGVGL